MRLYTRVALILGLVLTVFITAAGTLWLIATRTAVHEEVEAATRVAAQWIEVLAEETRRQPGAASEAALLARLEAVGRIRANRLTVGVAGQLRYVSPPPRYKAGQDAPAWFAALVAPDFTPRQIIAGNLVLTLYPDPSRAALDVWEEARWLAAGALLLLLSVVLAALLALARSLAPLDAVMRALDQFGRGRFDTRLPPSAAPEMARLAGAFNGMADRLAQAVDENVALAEAQDVAEAVRARLDESRREIARELHDELAQGITAVRALAGAIAQRDSSPAVQGAAGHILAATGEMQDGVRRILSQLHAAAPEHAPHRMLTQIATRWQQRHPDTALDFAIDPALDQIPAPHQAILQRIVQEGLSNLSRHAAARSATLTVAIADAVCTVCLDDNGCGPAAARPSPGCGLGLAGMRERLAPIGGRVHLEARPGGGCRLLAHIPLTRQEVTS